MQKTFTAFLVAALITTILFMPGQTASAQGISLPAEINKSFSPISISAGGTSRLSVTIFNPNVFALANASWVDNLLAIQPGLRIANPVGLTNSCGGTVTATAGATTFSLSGGTVPAQTGSSPGSCTVSVNVTSSTPGSLINRIPAGALSSTGGGENITNTTPASATLNVVGAPTPTVSKNFNPGTIWAGAVSQLSIVIANNSASTTLTQASLSDALPANVFLADPISPSLTGCGASASLEAVVGGTSVALNGGSIAPNSTCTIRVNVTSNEQGSYDNSIPANALQTQQGLTNLTGDTARLNVQEIGITKAFSPDTFTPGGTSTLTITLRNPTGSPYTGVSVSDTLPGNVLTVVPNSATSTCGVPPGTVTTTLPRTVSLSGGIIPAGSIANPGTCTISFQVTVPAGTPTSTFRNSIPVNTLTTAQGVSNLLPANANVTVRGTDLTGSKSFSPSTIPAGGNSRLRIDTFAPSDTDLTNFSITDNLPSGVTVSNSTAPNVNGCGAGVLDAPTGATTIRLTGGTIAAGTRCRIEVYVTSSTTGTYANSIPPTNITNNESRAPLNAFTSNLTVGSAGSLAISLVKGFDPLIVTGGASSTMSIELINPENVEMLGINFTDNMPTGMILANPVNFNVGNCGGALSGTPGSNSFSFSGGSLPPLGTCTLTLSATMTVNGNLTNMIPAGAVRTTNNNATNADPVEASLTNLPGASVSKAFSPNPIPANSYSLLTITIANTGNIGLTGMGMSDSLPAGLEIAGGSAPAPVNNCGGTLTAVAGTQLIELANGALAGDSTCTVVVAITGSNPGDYQNTIPVGGLFADPNTRNTSPASATLTITSGGGDPPPVSGGGGGGRPRNNNDRNETTTTVNTFSIPVTGFAPGRETKLDDASRIAYDATSLTLEIPVLKLKTSIVGVESNRGKWDVSWLQDQVGWLHGSAYPTWKGNSVLTAHVANADGQPGTFSKLKVLGVGEYVFVYQAGYRYTYKVVSNTFVEPDDASVMKHEEKSYLTLITCDSYDEKTGTYLRRVAVRAVLVDVSAVR